jgi:signal transduction histidine kinase
MREGIREERPVSVVLRNYREDGTAFWNEVDIAPVHDEDGAVTHYIGFQRDVTERKRLQTELETAQQSLRRLYGVTTDSALSFGERVERTLEIGCYRLGVGLGFVTRIDDGTQHIAHAVGDHPLLQKEAACPLSESYCRRTLDEEGLLSVVHAATDEGWNDDPGYETFGLECYIGGKVLVDGELYGTLCFADTEPRPEPFTASQAAFVELLTRWVGYELERRERERELRIADRRFRSLFENPLTFVGVLDPEGGIQEVNESALALVDGDPESVVGRPFWEAPWWADDEASVATVTDAVETAAAGRATPFECPYYHGDEQRTVSATLYPVYADDADAGGADGTDDDAGEVVSLMAVGTDTTTRTEQAAQLKRQRDRLEEFASVVSHDLRSPLEVARGRLQLYETTGDPENLAAVDDSLDRISTLIDDLLELARQGTAIADLEPVRVADVARRAWQTVDTEGATLDVTLSDAEGEGEVDGDPGRLRQLFENLFRNSVEHGSTGSRSGVGDSVAPGSTDGRSAARSDDPDPAPDDTDGGTADTARPDGLSVRLTPLAGDRRGFAVEDDGPGIAPEDRPHVFERGFTTDAAGTGFGLAIVQRIVEAHGWDVQVTESATGGARFEIHVDA